MSILPKPPWLRKKIVPAEQQKMGLLLQELKLSTVCQEALCPNISECFADGIATFLILGRHCSRRCNFCAIKKETPQPVDPNEPERIAKAVKRLSLSHIVITSPTRDDLDDGGAAHFAASISAIQKQSPHTAIEVLTPDFQGKTESLQTVLAARPTIFSHNLETVPRLYSIRAGAEYERSLKLLAKSQEIAPEIMTKTGIMLGLGETFEEVINTMKDARKASVEYMSISHYLPPSGSHHKLKEHVPGEVFDNLKEIGIKLGFKHIESSPFTRSSYHAKKYLEVM